MTTVVVRDMDKLEKILESPGELENVATIHVLRKNGHIFVELESDGSLSHHRLKLMLRHLAINLGKQP